MSRIPTPRYDRGSTGRLTGPVTERKETARHGTEFVPPRRQQPRGARRIFEPVGRARQGRAAVRFATKVATLRGHVSNEDFVAVKAAGYTDAQVVEIVQHVALNTWTNYINTVGQTDIDFPAVAPRKVA